MKNKLLCIFALLLLFFPEFSLSSTLVGKVVSIADGDTITILDSSKRQHKIRLYGIDCPEKGQAFGKAAKNLTAKLTARKQAEVKAYDTDKYGRIVGVVFADGINVNEEIVAAGLAWQYRKYCKASFCRDWLVMEDQARRAGLGIWADNDPVAPWEWRKGKRNSSYSKTSKAVYGSSTGAYHGNVKSHKFHSPNCRHYNCKNCVKEFESRDSAISAGYSPCGQCKP